MWRGWRVDFIEWGLGWVGVLSVGRWDGEVVWVSQWGAGMQVPRALSAHILATWGPQADVCLVVVTVIVDSLAVK